MSEMVEIRGDAEFSADGEGRYFRARLDRWWDDRPRALVCMTNPSMAGADRNDPTIHSLIRLLRPLDIGGFTVVNWEPYVATDPNDMRRWRASVDLLALAKIHVANLALIRALSSKAAMRLIAWGDLVPQIPHTTATLLAMSLDGSQPLYAFGLTKGRNPKHPLARGKSRIPDGTVPILWRTAADDAVMDRAQSAAVPDSADHLQSPASP